MSTRAKVLALYRSFMREAKRMPTANRTEYIKKKVRAEFRAAAAERDPEALGQALLLGETQLEAVQVQAAHLTRLAREGNLKGPR